VASALILSWQGFMPDNPASVAPRLAVQDRGYAVPQMPYAESPIMSNALKVVQVATYEQLLPSEVASQTGSWFVRARNYPIFSTTWLRYRTLAYITVAVLVAIFVALAVIVGGNESWRLGLSVALVELISVSALAFYGPAMAVLVCRRQWPRRAEAIALCMAIVLGTMASYGTMRGAKYCIKYVLLGNPDAAYVIRAVGGIANEQNADTVLVGDIKPLQANQPTPGTKMVAGADDLPKTNLASELFQVIASGLVGLLLFPGLIGGGFDLLTFFRQRRKLAEVLQARELAQAKAAWQEAELRLSVLSAQIEPHFLFNTLAGVRAAIVADPARATAIIDHLVEYLRATIPRMRDDGGTSLARLDSQIEAIRAYLSLMSARIPRLSFSIDVAAGLDAEPVPPLMLISLVENAVKHGIEPKVGLGRIEVSVARVEQDGAPGILLTVSDDGVGFGGATSGTGIGLTNIRERLVTLYAGRANLALKTRAGGGVAATIFLPT